VDSTQADFVRLAKAIGLGTARSILDLLDAFEGNEPQQAKKVSKRQQNALESLGEAVMNQLPQSRRGRKADPNSTRQRVRSAVLAYLKAHRTADIGVMFSDIANSTGIEISAVKSNANQMDGVCRKYGTWSLKQAA
jgi:hypothetical protein